MKKWIIALVILFAGSAFAETTVNFTWTPNPASDEITGYRLYMDGGYTNAIVQTITNPSANSAAYIIAADTVPHSFSLSAFRQSDGAESQHSDYAVWVPPVAECPPEVICPDCPPVVVCPEIKPISFTGSFEMTQDTE